MAINGDTDALLTKKNKKKSGGVTKSVAFVLIGGLTLVYCIAELIAALYLDSLTLLSDGFHNLSDVVSLYIAYWAQAAAKRDLSKEMSYGWARTEILGGLTNGCFLLSLCLYVGLEAIPKLIRPELASQLSNANGGYLFIGIAGVGLLLNILGTVVFAAVGVSHGHSHSHGHGHGHGHGHTDAKKHDDAHLSMADFGTPESSPALLLIDPATLSPHGEVEDHTHAHEHKKKDKSHQHSDNKVKQKKKDHKHSDEHSHAHDDEHSHAHKDKSHSHGHDDEHSHAHDDEHSHAHKDKHKDKDHKHKHDKGHNEKEHKHDEHKHGHGEKEHKRKKFSEMDVNTWAVFIHFLGDAISSLFVLGTGLLFHFFHADWTKYIDPISSILIVILIISTTVPLVKRCSMILLQSVPSEVDLDAVTAKTSTVEGVVSVHDLHVWQLVDGMIIASVHLLIDEGTDVGNIVYQVKEIFHSFGIHSSAIQPEFVKTPVQKDTFCAQNCVEECEADWCCKKTADKDKEDLHEYYSTFTEPV